jgi:hypothetical protein
VSAEHKYLRYTAWLESSQGCGDAFPICRPRPQQRHEKTLRVYVRSSLHFPSQIQIPPRYMRDLPPHFVVYFAALDQLGTQLIFFFPLTLEQVSCLFNHGYTPLWYTATMQRLGRRLCRVARTLGYCWIRLRQMPPHSRHTRPLCACYFGVTQFISYVL